MEKFDEAFSKIKMEESCPDLEEIVSTFDRHQSKKEDIMNNEYLICNQIANINQNNNILKKHITEMKGTVKELEGVHDENEMIISKRDK